MRITGGRLCGRRVRVPRVAGVRPTQDRVREAMFSSLAARLDGASFLDLFAGSGVVGLEAWSRGAESVSWVERNARVLKQLKDNVREFCGTDSGVFRGSALGFVNRCAPRQPFDIVFADPPYGSSTGPVSLRGGGKDSDIEAIMLTVARRQLLAEDGIFVLELATEENFAEPAGWRVIDDRKYGRTKLRLFTLQPDDLEDGK